jgi:hypothetical protein
VSYLNRIKGAAPATPAAGKTTQYVDASGLTHELNDTGVDNILTGMWRNNYLRNSGFWFAQRQNPAALTTYSSATNRLISADGWGITCENASAQYIRTDTNAAPEAGLQSRFYGQFTKITSLGKLVMTQCIEGSDAESLRGRTVRVQVWMRGLVAASANWNIALVNNTGTVDAPTAAFIAAMNGNGTDPTLGASLAYLAPKATVTPDNGTIVGATKIQCTVTNSATWARYGGCFDVPTTAKNLIVMIWSDSQVAATNGVALGQASLTDGFEIQAWSPFAVQEELARVQRFYCKSFSVDTLPAQSVAIGAIRGYVSVAGATAGQPIGLRYPVAMRAAPTTFTFFNPAAANAFARNTTAGTDATATASANAGDEGADVTFTGIAAWTVAQAVAVQFTADAEI